MKNLAVGVCAVFAATMLSGCTGDGLRVTNDPDADAFAQKTVNTAFGKWDADALCSVTAPVIANCRGRLTRWFRHDKAAFGDLVRANATGSKTYWAFMRNIKDAYYDYDLTYFKGPTHLEMYIMNLDNELGVSPGASKRGWQVVWYQLHPEASQ